MNSKLERFWFLSESLSCLKSPVFALMSCQRFWHVSDKAKLRLILDRWWQSSLTRSITQATAADHSNTLLSSLRAQKLVSFFPTVLTGLTGVIVFVNKPSPKLITFDPFTHSLQFQSWTQLFNHHESDGEVKTQLPRASEPANHLLLVNSADGR